MRSMLKVLTVAALLLALASPTAATGRATEIYPAGIELPAPWTRLRIEGSLRKDATGEAVPSATPATLHFIASAVRREHFLFAIETPSEAGESDELRFRSFHLADLGQGPVFVSETEWGSAGGALGEDLTRFELFCQQSLPVLVLSTSTSPFAAGRRTGIELQPAQCLRLERFLEKMRAASRR
jgi:hypothetical protein